MRYAIFADVHGNLEALEAVFAALAEERIDRYFCCGDIVGYGANPKECLALVRSKNTAIVAGNHDWAAAGKRGIENFNPWARAAIAWTQKRLDESEKNFLSALPLVLEESDFVLTHGTLHEPENFYYMDSLADATMSFRLLNKPLCFVGHNHVPAIIVRRAEEISYSVGYPVQIAGENQYIINVGSVGQPRDGRPQAAFCIYDTNSRSAEIHRALYSVAAAQKKILQAGLPEALARRLGLGF